MIINSTIVVLWAVQKQIPPLRCGMTNKKGQYGDPGCARMTAVVGSCARITVRFGYLSSKRRMAPAMVVVQRPFLSPTADWVTLAVRTILLEMR